MFGRALLGTSNGGGTPTVDLTQGQVAHYLLNNNANDSHGTSDGTPAGGVDFQGDMTKFDGVDDYISANNLRTLLNYSVNHTVSFWVYLTELGSYKYIIEQTSGSASTSVFGIRVDDLNKVRHYHYEFKVGDDRKSVTSSDTALGLGWNHVVITSSGFNATARKMFINGVESTITIVAEILPSLGYPPATTHDARIGSTEGLWTTNPDVYSDIGLSNIRVYDEVKDQTFVDALFAEGYYPKPLPLPTTDGLISHFKLTGTAEDETGNYDGTENGGLTYDDNPQFGSVASFDGTSKYIALPNMNLDVSSDFTVCIMARNIAGTSYNRYILQQLDGTGLGRALLFIDTAGKLCSFLGGSLLTTTFTYTSGIWFFVTVTYTSATNQLKIDVDNQNVLTTTVSIEANIGTFRIGVDKTFTSTSYWNGNCRSVYFFNSVLLSTDKTNIFNYETNFRPIDIDDSLEAYYPLAQNSLDNYKNQYDGTDTDVTYDGLSGVFNGTTSVVDTASGTPITSSDVTMAVWAKSDIQTTSTRMIMFQQGGSVIASGRGVMIASDNRVIAFSRSGSATYYSIIHTLPNLQTDWNHIVLIDRGTSSELYVNGVFINSVARGSNYTFSTILKIGCSRNNSDLNDLFFDGVISKGRVKSKAITAEQVAVIYNTEKGDFGL